MKVEKQFKELHTYFSRKIQNSTQFVFIEGIGTQFINSFTNFLTLLLPKQDKVIISELQNIGYKKFSAFETLAKSLLLLNSLQKTKLLKKYEKSLSKIAPQLYGKSEVTESNIADSIVLAVVRRISRESHHSALLINNAANFCLELIGESLTRNNNINIILPDFDYWDRPSLRIIHRINKLNQNTKIRWIAFTRYTKHLPETNIDELTGKILYSHFSFIDKFKQIQPNAKIFQLNDGGNIELPQPVLNSLDINLNEMAVDLAFQNYERVYNIARLALDRSLTKENKSKILRLVALADASRGDYKEAYKQLENAFKLARRNSFKAHLKYLQGLIYTKRFYNLEIANNHYNQGLELLKNTNETNKSVYAPEKAWLLNGKALVHTLKAKSLSKEKKAEEMLTSFNLELTAYNLVKEGNSPNLSYLRYNLLANITFLLEINKKYDDAIDFWIRAFERYLTKNNPAFEVAFKTRLGLLQYKAGKNIDAKRSLKESYQICSKLEDPFYEQRILYTYAYVLYNCKDYKEATKYFTRGVRITFKIKEPDDFEEHLKGLLLASIMSKDEQSVKIICKTAILNKNMSHHIYKIILNTDSLLKINKYLQEANIKLKEPEPKLSSYIPSVDLEGIPEKDLNRYLVSSKTIN